MERAIENAYEEVSAAAVAAFEQPAHVEQVPVPAFQLRPPLLYVHRLTHTRWVLLDVRQVIDRWGVGNIVSAGVNRELRIVALPRLAAQKGCSVVRHQHGDQYYR